MSPTKQTLHNLIDMVSVSDVNTLFHLLMKFVPEDEPLKDEKEIFNNSDDEKHINHNEIDWN